MAMYDWNGNENCDDIIDDFIEYEMYKDYLQNYTPTSSGSSSCKTTFIVFIICCIIAAFNELIGAGIFLGYLFLKFLGL